MKSKTIAFVAHAGNKFVLPFVFREQPFDFYGGGGRKT